MQLEFLVQPRCSQAADVQEARRIASQLSRTMDCGDVRSGLGAIPPVGGSSHEVDAIVHPHAKRLGFLSQRQGLFDEYPVSLRPDWYRPLGGWESC